MLSIVQNTSGKRGKVDRRVSRCGTGFYRSWGRLLVLKGSVPAGSFEIFETSFEFLAYFRRQQLSPGARLCV